MFLPSGNDFAMASSLPSVATRNLQVALRFVCNYAPRGLSPQIYDMPVIQEKGTGRLLCRSLNGDYLLFRFRSTIGVMRFNFSVRNGKRWSPHALVTLISLSIPSSKTLSSLNSLRLSDSLSLTLQSSVRLCRLRLVVADFRLRLPSF